MLEYNYYQNYHLASSMERCQVLDLSRRRDSVETRKTPSPCNTTSSFGTDSPSTQRESPFSLPLHHTLISQQNSSFALLGRHPIKSPPSLPASSYPIAYPEFKREDASPPQNVASSYTCRPKNIMEPVSVATNPSLESPKINQQEPEDRDAAAVETDGRLSEIPMQAMPYNIQPGPVPILYPKILSNEGKLTRPFKAYPRDPLIIAANFAATDVLYDSPRVERYTEYRKRVLEQIQTANGGQRTVTNPKMRRINSKTSRQDLNHSDTQAFVSSESEDRCAESSDDTASNSGKPSIKTNGDDSLKKNNNSEAASNGNRSVKDAAYYERRRKNNAAAKKSRDRRRIKEDEIAIRAAYLERQNIELLCQLDALKAQLAALTKC